MKRRPPFYPRLWDMIRRAIYRQGVSAQLIDLARAKWEAGLEVYQIGCEEEGKGKPYGLESGCTCGGCQQRRCFALFDQVRTLLGTGD